MEKELDIKTCDGLTIKGILYKKEENAENLVIFLHGLTSNMNAYHIKAGVEFFYNKGFAVYGYSQYSDEELNGKKPRALYEGITLTRQKEDLKDIFNFFKNDYKNIYLVGHSYGALTIAIANLPCKAQGLWDPVTKGDLWDDAKYKTEGDRFFRKLNGTLVDLNNAMKEDSYNYTNDKVKDICKNIKTPTLTIGSLCSWGAYNTCYKDFIKNSDFYMIEADHNFTKLGQVQEVCEKTYNFFVENM